MDTKCCRVPGFPANFLVAPPAALTLVAPKQAFAGRKFTLSVDCADGELPGKLSATAQLSDGSILDCDISG
jgi:hypothetical protein